MPIKLINVPEDPNTVTKDFTSAFVLDKAKLTRILNITEDRFKESGLEFLPRFEVIHADGKKISLSSVEDLFSLDNTVRNPISELNITAINPHAINSDMTNNPFNNTRVEFTFDNSERRNISLRVTTENGSKVANQTFAELEEQIERTFLNSWVYKYLKSEAFFISLMFILFVGFAILLFTKGSNISSPDFDRVKLRTYEIEQHMYADDQYLLSKAKQANTTEAKIDFLFEKETRNLGNIEPPTVPTPTPNQPAKISSYISLKSFFIILPGLIILVCIAYVITKCYPRATFLWGDYETYYTDLMNRKRTLWSVVVLALLLGIVGNLFVFGITDSLSHK